MTRIAVINEVSASLRNPDIMAALKEIEGIEVYNVGMTSPDEKPELTYIQTGIMAGALLNEEKVDYVVGGCGTGQGFLNVAMQFPGVSCGLITNPLDAWLFSQINAGNCISLALNKGYGWAGDINVKYIFRELFRDTPGQGYPPSRGESQAQSRLRLKAISKVAHREMPDILRQIAPELLTPISKTPAFMDLIRHTSCGTVIEEAAERGGRD